MDLSEARHIEEMLASLPAATLRPATVLPRFIRHKDAPAYLGVDRNKFDVEIRPALTEIPLGKRSLAFDRLDLDAWADEYKRRNGRSSRKMGKLSCEQEQKVFKSSKAASVPSTKSTKGSASSPGLEQSAKSSRKRGSGTGSEKSMSGLDRALRAISAMEQKRT